MNIASSLIVVAFAALIHASFQLSVSVLSLLSSHTIGAKRSHTKLVRLVGSYIFGAAVMTLLLLAATALFLLDAFPRTTPQLVWVIVCGVLVSLAIAVWLFYYRHEKGTTLWVPRGIARYLSERTKATKYSAEAFGLGLSSVAGEVLFIFAPVIISALVIIHLPTLWQLVGLTIYTVISLLSLLIVGGLVGSGHRLSTIQRWREKNKHFLQFAAGGGLLVLGFFIYVNEVVAATAFASGGF